MLSRKPNWAVLLDRYICACSRRTFQYGSFDCCLFVCDAIREMTGVDVAAPLRGQYGSRKQAYRAIENYAGRATVEAVTERVTHDHQMPEIGPARAQRGDVVLVHRKLDSLGLVGLDGRFLAASAQGYESVPSQLVTRAWRI